MRRYLWTRWRVVASSKINFNRNPTLDARNNFKGCTWSEIAPSINLFANNMRHFNSREHQTFIKANMRRPQVLVRNMLLTNENNFPAQKWISTALAILFNSISGIKKLPQVNSNTHRTSAAAVWPHQSLENIHVMTKNGDQRPIYYLIWRKRGSKWLFVHMRSGQVARWFSGMGNNLSKATWVGAHDSENFRHCLTFWSHFYLKRMTTLRPTGKNRNLLLLMRQDANQDIESCKLAGAVTFRRFPPLLLTSLSISHDFF